MEMIIFVLLTQFDLPCREIGFFSLTPASITF